MTRWLLRTLAATVVSLALFTSGCVTPTDPWEGETGSPRVVVTIAPLESFVRAVGGPGIAVRSLCTQTGPHHYRPDTRDARLLGKADLFLAIGLSLDEPFADPMYHSARNKDLPYVKLGELFPESALREMTHECCKHDEAGHVHKHDKWDPHLWMGPPEAIRLVELIRDQLTKIKPDEAALYKKNAAAYVAELKKLHTDGKAMLAPCTVRRVVSFHEALGYFAPSFDIVIADVIEEGPGDEPTQGHLADLIKVCSDPKKPIGAITVEPQYPTSSSATIIQRELKQKHISLPLATIDPLETGEPADLAREGGDWYIKRMRQNIQSLRDTLPGGKKTP